MQKISKDKSTNGIFVHTFVEHCIQNIKFYWSDRNSLNVNKDNFTRDIKVYVNMENLNLDI